VTDPSAPDAEATVVIATRNRADLLMTCLDALARQCTNRRFELVVVDDGSEPALKPIAPAGLSVRMLRSEGVGPARARNLGIAVARGKIVLFTDDDTAPKPTWVEAACSFLETHPTATGVEGPVMTRPYDRLYEMSIENVAPGAYWTCNVAYRRAILEELEGFDEKYPYPHCEDRDLGLRARERGPIGFSPDMTVYHEPRRFSLRDAARRGTYAGSELRLLKRFANYFRTRSSLPLTVQPLVNGLHLWRDVYRGDARTFRRSPRRLLRLALYFAAYEVAAMASVVRWSVSSK
jgi:GT2 family glycosyltransferase